MTIAVRPAKQQDLPELVELYQQLIGEKEELAEVQKRFARMQEDAKATVLVAEDTALHKVVATAMCIFCPSLIMGGRPFLVIEDVVVSQQCRGQGIGTILFEEIDRLAQREGCSYSMLVSSDFRKEAHQFYGKAGFQDPVKGFRKIYGKG
ncbi:putative acetyltransferase [uncultured Ruminococcus sp.]|uniref:GNAT family N-acetyltransferase n=1 Tax=Massiliimalia timonensis TaxID=1987501 RepID=UPI000820A56A|nr:GNAT family N-acetyltransferase [Massiliimalia timonensis]MBS7174591.1 GNAT family N-acetyltransferase [Clostridiales bacterium]SCH62992.1 putative acetyltransferase [uncultured Clostridium sp.]SCH77653.1 putative acetyltransferase [uncultured Ruminococcus sp.]